MSNDLLVRSLRKLVNKWEREIRQYDADNVGSADPEDWMAGHRECLSDLREIMELINDD